MSSRWAVCCLSQPSCYTRMILHVYLLESRIVQPENKWAAETLISVASFARIHRQTHDISPLIHPLRRNGTSRRWWNERGASSVRSSSPRWCSLLAWHFHAHVTNVRKEKKKKRKEEKKKLDLFLFYCVLFVRTLLTFYCLFVCLLGNAPCHVREVRDRYEATNLLLTPNNVIMIRNEHDGKREREFNHPIFGHKPPAHSKSVHHAIILNKIQWH